MTQSRQLAYWSCFLGVSVRTIAREFEGRVWRLNGTRLLKRADVERRYPEAFQQATL